MQMILHGGVNTMGDVPLAPRCFSLEGMTRLTRIFCACRNQRVKTRFSVHMHSQGGKPR